MALPHLFEFWAFDHQLPPEGDWRTWVILGGRGAGKTRAGAEWVRSQVEGSLPLDAGCCRRVALVGETFDQVRDVMVFGESGIMACSLPDRRPIWEATRRRLVWPNGAVAQAYSAHEPEALRGPQFDAAWVDEYGCAAVDKGTNQPNKFIDPKSSESQLPYFSNGRRDDVIQAQYLRAMTSYWTEDANNPISEIYQAPMIDMSRAHVWAWDARPYPNFPANDALWNDGDNYLRGHWLNGRGSSQALDRIVATICADVGVSNVDVSSVYGVVRGYAPSSSGSARQQLQPLMLAYGFDAIERDGKLVFQMRDGREHATLELSNLAVTDATTGDITLVRAPEAEVAGRLRLTFLEADSDFPARSEEAIFPDEESQTVAQSDVPLVLTSREARSVVERWLNEARVARDVAHFALPLSDMAIRAGDVVAIPQGDNTSRYRIDRLEQAEYQVVEAVRIDPETYEPSDAVDTVVRQSPFVAPLPVQPVFLDLPLLSGDEVPHAPHITATAQPWPGSVAVYSAGQDDGYTLDTLLPARGVVGLTETALIKGNPGLIQRGASVRVKFVYGDLSSATEVDFLNGANAIAVGDGSSGNWEVLQFRDAALVAPRTYDLSHLLRGHLGTDGIMPETWPIGSVVVVLNAALTQIDLAQSARGLARHYRIGPAQRAFDDPSYQHRIEAFHGIGLRPYAPVHLRHTSNASGDDKFSWVRRTRIDGDSWQSTEVPLGETSELYQVRILNQGSVVREAQVSNPAFEYTASSKSDDGLVAAYDFEVAQVSDRFGPGPFRRITINE